MPACGVGEIPRHLSAIVDAKGKGADASGIGGNRGVGIVEGGVGAAVVHETMETRGVSESSRHLSAIVDAKGIGEIVEGGVGAAVVHENMVIRDVRVVRVSSYHLSAIVDAKGLGGTTFAAWGGGAIELGSSRVV